MELHHAYDCKGLRPELQLPKLLLQLPRWQYKLTKLSHTHVIMLCTLHRKKLNKLDENQLNKLRHSSQSQSHLHMFMMYSAQTLNNTQLEKLLLPLIFQSSQVYRR